MKCKYFIKEIRNQEGGICGYSNCCPHINDPSVYCPIKEVVHLHEKKWNQQDPPTQREIEEAARAYHSILEKVRKGSK